MEQLGDREVDGVLNSVAASQAAPLAERLAVYEQAHQRLHHLLTQGPGPSPDSAAAPSATAPAAQS